MITTLEGNAERMAYFAVSYELLIDLLKLPEGTKIRKVTDTQEGMGPCFVVVVEHPTLLEPIEIGQRPPRIMPRYVSHYDEAGNQIGFDFDGW